MNSNRLAVLVAVLALVLTAGCRSNGGWGRADTAQGMAFSTSRVADRFAYNTRRTWYLVKSVPGALAQSIEDAPVEMSNTCSLYFEGHAKR